MKSSKNFDHIFVPLSKIVIILPIVVVIVALVLKASDKLTLTSKQTAPMPKPALESQVTETPPPEVNIDLNGPYRCVKSRGDESAILYIKNKQMYAELNKGSMTDKFLLKGDCAYRWRLNQGDKACGVSQLMGIYEAMSAVGAADVNTILNLISSSGMVTATDEALISDVVETCKKGEVSDGSFMIPTNVNFKQSDILKNLPPF